MVEATVIEGPQYPKMKMEYTIAWVVWGALILGAEVARVTNPLVWAALLALFLVIEGIGLYRKKPGDTLTEHLLTFRRGGWTRTFLVLGFVGWAGFKFYSLVQHSGIAGICLASGFGLWFLFHILLEAKHG